MNSPDNQNHMTAELDSRCYYFGRSSATCPSGGEAVLLTDLPAHKAAFSRIGLAIFVLTMAYQGAAVVLSLLFTALAPAATETWWYSWLLTDLSLYGVGLPCMWLVIRQVPKAPYNQAYHVRGGGNAYKPRFCLGTWLVIAVIGAGVMQIGGLIGNGVMEGLSRLVGYDYANGLESMVSETPLWMTFLGTVVIAPFGEELLFRKLLIDRTRRWGDGVSILLSGILFGLFHGNLFQLFYTTLIGFLLAYVYTRSGSYWWCVGLHALVNFLGGILPTLLQNWIGREHFESDEALTEHLLANPAQFLVYMLYALAIWAVMLAAVVLLLCLRKRVKIGGGADKLPRGHRFSTVMLNTGMVLAFVAGLLILLINLIPLSA